ncbi:hypothetical protein RCL1_001637 [Eukaryota sp. TZLM3-RCL]
MIIKIWSELLHFPFNMHNVDALASKLPAITSEEEFASGLKKLDYVVYAAVAYGAYMAYYWGFRWLAVSFISALVTLIIYGIFAAASFYCKILVAKRDHDQLKLVTMALWGIAAYSAFIAVYSLIFYRYVSFFAKISAVLQRLILAAVAFAVGAQSISLKSSPFYLSASTAV